MIWANINLGAVAELYECHPERSEGSFFCSKNEILPPAFGGTQNDRKRLSNRLIIKDHLL